MAQYQIYKDEQGEWRWRLLGKNMQIVAVSGEGFKRRDGAIKSARKMPEWANTTVISQVV